MKMKIIFAAACAALVTGCASGTKDEEFKAGFTDCALMCKDNREIKEYSQKAGGGFVLLFFGGEEKKCACNR